MLKKLKTDNKDHKGEIKYDYFFLYSQDKKRDKKSKEIKYIMFLKKKKKKVNKSNFQNNNFNR